MIENARINSRKMLKILTRHQTNKVIQKHQIELIAIIGSHGTTIAREALYSILSKKFDVRRNTRPVWWDMSIPLTILGYEDKRYSIIEWNKIAAKGWGAYVRNKTHKHKIIINLDTKHEDNAKFWGDIITPEAVLLLNIEEKDLRLFNSIVKNENKVRVVVNSKDSSCCKAIKEIKKGSKKFYTFGKEESDLIYEYKDGILSLKYKNQVVEIKLNVPYFEIDPIAGSVLVALTLGVSLTQIKEGLTVFELHPEIINNVIKKIRQ